MDSKRAAVPKPSATAAALYVVEMKGTLNQAKRMHEVLLVYITWLGMETDDVQPTKLLTNEFRDVSLA